MRSIAIVGLGKGLMYDKPKSVMLAYITGGMVHHNFMQSVVRFLRKDEQERNVFYKIVAGEGLYLDVNRNACVIRFLNSPADVLLFIDTDIVFETEAVYRLLDDVDAEHEIVSGLYFGFGTQGENGNKQNVLYPIWFDKEEDERRYRFVKQFSPGLQRLGAVGMGFCALHRKALERMQPGRWFERLLREGDGYDRRINYGEDMAFCVRATEAGIPIWGDGSVGVRHMKATALDFESFLKFWDIRPPEALASATDVNGVAPHG